MNYDINKDLQIDQTSLDVEWLNQAHLTYKYGEASAQAKARMEKAKEDLETLTADIQLRIRSNPAKYGMEKVTESMVTTAAQVSPEVKKAAQAYREARNEFDMIGAALRAVEAKRSALEHLVRLLQMNYFSAPSEPRKILPVVPREEPPAQRPASTMDQTAIRNRIRRRLNA